MAGRPARRAEEVIPVSVADRAAGRPLAAANRYAQASSSAPSWLTRTKNA